MQSEEQNKQLDDTILRKQQELSRIAQRIEDKKRRMNEEVEEHRQRLEGELAAIRSEIEEKQRYLQSIRETAHYDTEQYLSEVVARVGTVHPALIDTDETFQLVGEELKKRIAFTEERVKSIRENTFIANSVMPFAKRMFTKPDDIVYQCLSSMCIQYLNLLIAQQIKNPYKMGLDKSLQQLASIVSRVERHFPEGVSVRVPADYIAAKKEEIKLAYEIEEYKARQAEERRAILQAQREELAAQREIEREIQRARKDEQEAQAKLERRRMELAQAHSAAEIARLKDYIERLQLAVKEAQQRHERALSMAQQTRAGYVYVISNIGSFGEGVYKIGMTRRIEPMERVVELGDASVPFPFDVHAMIWSEDAPTLEAELHRTFDDRKVNAINGRKEFFRVTLDEVRTVLSRMGVDAAIVDYPTAAQYRDSLMMQS